MPVASQCTGDGPSCDARDAQTPQRECGERRPYKKGRAADHKTSPRKSETRGALRSYIVVVVNGCRRVTLAFARSTIEAKTVHDVSSGLMHYSRLEVSCGLTWHEACCDGTRSSRNVMRQCLR